jgi:hypothetical protein
MIAYISDCTEASSRSAQSFALNTFLVYIDLFPVSSRVFSLFLGSLYTGTAIGPTLGGLLLRATHRNILSVFYAAVALDGLFLLLSWTLLPESLSRERRQAAQRAHAAEITIARAADAAGLRGAAARFSRSLLHFTTPLGIFLPNPRVEDSTSQGLLVAVKKDWRLPTMVLSYFFAFISLVRKHTVMFGNKSLMILGVRAP